MAPLPHSATIDEIDSSQHFDRLPSTAVPFVATQPESQLDTREAVVAAGTLAWRNESLPDDLDPEPCVSWFLRFDGCLRAWSPPTPFTLEPVMQMVPWLLSSRGHSRYGFWIRSTFRALHMCLMMSSHRCMPLWQTFLLVSPVGAAGLLETTHGCCLCPCGS